MRLLLLSCLLLAASLGLQGCTTTIGEFRPNTQYVHPGSSVKVVGPMEFSKRKVGIIVGRSFTPAEILELYKANLPAGANQAINFSSDTKTTFIPFLPINIVEYKFSGTAATITPGK